MKEKVTSTSKDDLIESGNEIKRTGKGTFAKGHSGNPKGRPRMTEEQKAEKALEDRKEDETMRKLKSLAPRCAEIAEEMLESPDTPPAVKARLIEMIIERVYGKAQQSVDISSDSSMEFGVVMMPSLKEC